MRILVLADFSNIGLRVIDACRRWAGRIVVVTPSGATPLAHSWRLDRLHVLPLASDGAAAAGSVGPILDICDSEAIDAVIGADMDGARMLNALRASRPDIRGSETMADGLLAAAGDKARFAALLRKAGLPEPSTDLAATPERLLEIGAARRFPLVVKPVDLAGGSGVVRLADPPALRAYVESHRGGFRPVAVQDYLPGREIGVSAYVARGRILGMTVQAWTSPFSLRYVNHPRAAALGRAAIERLGLGGPVNFDLREDAGGQLHFMECNPRFWATLNLSAALGANFVELAVRSSLGENPGFRPPPTDRTMVTLRGARQLLLSPGTWGSMPREVWRSLAWEAGDLGATAHRASEILRRKRRVLARPGLF